MKIKGCLLVRPPMLNARSTPDQKWANFGGFGGLGVRGFKLRFSLQKARPCLNPRRLSHFASKSVEGCDLRVGSGKNPESHRGSDRKDMSPLTQGLNYFISLPYCFFAYISRNKRPNHLAQRMTVNATRSSAVAGRPCDAKACQG